MNLLTPTFDGMSDGMSGIRSCGAAFRAGTSGAILEGVMTSANLLLAMKSDVEMASWPLCSSVGLATWTGESKVGLGSTAAAVRTLLFFLAMTAEAPEGRDERGDR